MPQLYFSINKDTKTIQHIAVFILRVSFVRYYFFTPEAAPCTTIISVRHIEQGNSLEKIRQNATIHSLKAVNSNSKATLHSPYRNLEVIALPEKGRIFLHIIKNIETIGQYIRLCAI